MDNQTQFTQPVQTTKPISDDQELAKVLAGITNSPSNNFGYEAPQDPRPTTLAPADIMPPSATPSDNPAASTPTPQTMPNNNLDSIRKDALIELRPLVDKLDLAPEEKFDIYLLLLRSTDDTALIAPAHEAAKNIANESKRAEALLDIIKEIDFLSVPQQPIN